MSFCTHCGTELGERAAHCMGCGRALLEPSATEVDDESAPVADRPRPDDWPLGQFPEGGVPPEPSPRWPVAEERPRPHPGRWLLAAALAVVSVLGAGVVLHVAGDHGGGRVALPQATPSPRGSATPSTTSTPSAPATASSPPAPAAPLADARAAAAARQVNALLNSSTPARATIRHAMYGLADCSISPSTAVTEMDGVVHSREALLDRAAAAPFERLPSGERLRGLLKTAWTYSLQADRAYLTWAEDFEVTDECGSDHAGFTDGNSASGEAEDAKQEFATLWNARVAERFDLPERTQEQL